MEIGDQKVIMWRMKGKSLTYIVLLATITVAGTMLLQFFFLRHSYRYSEKQFRESTAIALKEVAWQLLSANGNQTSFDSISPVEIISDRYYKVTIDGVIEHELLRYHLDNELKKHQIYTDVEFAINNPVTGRPEQQTLISARGTERLSTHKFPEWKNTGKPFFTVYFPDRSPYFHSSLSAGYLFTTLLLIIILFFGYTISVIIRQRQLSQIQKDFINNLTHELKTPISSIALSAKVISENKIINDPKKLQEYARIIEEQNNRLANQVEKVLNLASLEKNKLTLNKEKIDLHQFFEEIPSLLRHTEGSRQPVIFTQIRDHDSFLVADRFHFTNLVANILENSIKYCDKYPEIKIEVLDHLKYMHIRFTDNGIGISKKYRKKIFRRFYRIPTGNVHNVKGFGLGLDYVHKIVKAHGWRIKVDENPAGGTIFMLLIPKKR